jgi:hypothetical protein
METRVLKAHLASVFTGGASVFTDLHNARFYWCPSLFILPLHQLCALTYRRVSLE